MDANAIQPLFLDAIRRPHKPIRQGCIYVMILIHFARRQLGELAFEALAAEGRAMALEQAVAYALESDT